MSVPHLPFETITVGTVFSGGGLMILLTLLIRQVGPWRKQTTDATDALIKQLSDRLDKAEKTREADRRANYIQLARVEARYAAQLSLTRHKFNNADANLDSLLRILELSPEKASEAARQAREARSQQRQDELLEGAEIHKAEMLAASVAEQEFDQQKTLEV